MEFQNDNINTSEQYEINSWDDLNIDNVIASSGTSFQGSSINLYSDLLEIEEDNRIGQDNAEIMNRLQLTLKPSSRLLNRVSSSSKPRTTGG